MRGVDSMDDFHKLYNDYMDCFAIIPREEKKNEIIKKIKEINMIMMDLSNRVGISTELLLSDDIKQLEESNKEDDYLKALFSYLICLEDLLGKYLDKTISN